MRKRQISKTMAILLLALSLVCSDLVLFRSKTVKADMVPCTHCGGSGKTLCTSCGGQGMKSCTMCGGSGGTFQTVYGGIDPITGMIKQTTMRVSCTACGGSGRSLCFSCNGSGRSNCIFCGGTGIVQGSTSGGSSSGGNSSGGSSSGNDSSDNGSSCKDSSDNCSSGSLGTTVKGTVLDATPGVVSNEGGINLFDDNQYTKFNFIATSGFIIWEAPELIKVKSYVLMTANDTEIYTGRNPRTWVLYGSNEELLRNSDKWVEIHAVDDDTVLEPKNYTEYTFKLKSEAKAYKYFKLEILDNKGDPCTQLSELTLKGTVVTSKATSLSSVKKSGTTLKVKWKKKSGVTGYQIQYSTSSSFKNATEVTVKGNSKTSQTIKKLAEDKKYYIRIRTYRTENGMTVYSKWSKKKTAG